MVDIVAVREQMKTLIDGSTPDVIEQFVNGIVKTEKDRRAGLLADGFKKQGDAEAVFAKIKPDHLVFDESGAMVSQGYTANRKGERDKAQKLLARYTTAVNTALTGDFKLLEEALKGGGKDADAG